MFEIGRHRIQHQVATVSGFKTLVSSAEVNDEKVTPVLKFEKWKQGMEAGGIIFFTGKRI